MADTPATPPESGDERLGQSAQPLAARSVGDPEKIKALALEAARLCHDDKCTDVVVLDVRDLSPVTDYLVIATGTSDRQMRSVLDHVEDLGSSMDFPPFKVSRDDGTLWLLADFVDVVVHLFEPNARAHYDLEMLWGDAPRVEWRRPGDPRSGITGPGPRNPGPRNPGSQSPAGR
ncbi:MAG: ribosome silencing factor [Phycisphaerales bacterium]